MTSTENSTGVHSIAWLASLCLHAGLAWGALVVTQRLMLAPHPTPFTWNVAMINATSEPIQPPAAPPTPKRTPLHKPSFQEPLPNPSPTSPRDSSQIKTGTLEPPRPASREPIALTTDDPQEDAQIRSQQAQLSSESAPLTPTPLQDPEPVSPAQTSNVAPALVSTPRPDYAWLSETIMRRIEQLKRYPAEARLDRAEGKVVLKAVIRSDGSIESLEIVHSSGHESLDRAAVDLLNLAAPFHLPRPLDRPQMTVKIPMSYRIE